MQFFMKFFNSVFQQLSGIDIERDKPSEIFRFSLFLYNFCQVLIDIVDEKDKTPKAWVKLLFRLAFVMRWAFLMKTKTPQSDLNCQEI